MVVSCPFCEKAYLWNEKEKPVIICECGKAIFIASSGTWYHSKGEILKKKNSYNRDIDQ